MTLITCSLFWLLVSSSASCDPLQILRNGKIHNNGNENGALVSFSCNEGFKLQGLRQIKCVQGKWNGTIPTCESLRYENGLDWFFGEIFLLWAKIRRTFSFSFSPKGNCKNREPFKNGSIIGEDYSSGSSIQFRCNVGYQLLGSEIITCVKGTWNETIPECKSKLPTDK